MGQGPRPLMQRRAGEVEDGGIDAGGFDDAAALDDVAVEHGQTAVLRVGVGHIADAARLPCCRINFCQPCLNKAMPFWMPEAWRSGWALRPQNNCLS